MGETEAATEVRYKVGDICRLADVQPYVLRYWESEFPVLAADRTIPGPRSYSARELKIIERIKKLLYDEGYTIAGAKKRLETELPALDAAASFEAPSLEPPPLPATASAVRKRSRRATSDPAQPALVETAEEPMFDAPAKKEPDVSTGSYAPADEAVPAATLAAVVAAPPAPDPRLARILGELKELHALLSRQAS